MRRPHALLASLMIAALGSCSLAEDGALPLRIAINVGALARTTQGDFNSVMDQVSLVVADATGAEQTLSRRLEAGEFDPAFDVTVNEGQTSFTATVLSTNGLELYRGVETTTIDRDGFEVTIVPQPLRGVLVASPRRPAFPLLFTSSDFQLYGATLVVRNAGSAELSWRVLPSPSPNQFAIGCEIDSNDDVQVSCLEFTNLLPDGQVTILVSFRVIGGGPVPTSGVTFDSNVGTFLVPSVPKG